MFPLNQSLGCCRLCIDILLLALAAFVHSWGQIVEDDKSFCGLHLDRLHRFEAGLMHDICNHSWHSHWLPSACTPDPRCNLQLLASHCLFECRLYLVSSSLQYSRHSHKVKQPFLGQSSAAFNRPGNGAVDLSDGCCSNGIVGASNK